MLSAYRIVKFLFVLSGCKKIFRDKNTEQIIINHLITIVVNL